MPASGLQETDLVPYSAAHEVGRGPALVLAPHPDDEVLGCAGAILRHVAAREGVRIVVVTDGGAGDEPDRSAYVVERRRESEEAARVLGCETPPEFWDLEDRSLEYSEEMIGRIGEAIERTGASIVYAPSPEEVHPDHNALGLCALEAVRRASREIRVALYEVSAPLQPNLLLDISDLVARKRAAIACFASQTQRHAFDEVIAGLNRYRTYTLPASVHAAEAYHVLSRSELREDPLRCFVARSGGPERRSRRGALGSPLISVIVRTTGRDTLDEALDSIAAQTYPNVEIILVDAKGGLGFARSILSRGGRFPVRVAGGEGALRRGAAANAGLDAAKGVFLAFLDDDDWLYPHHLARLHKALSLNRYAQASYAGIDMIEEQADGRRKRVSAYNDPWDPARLLCENYIPIHAVLFRRSLITERGCRFDEALPVCEDWDFWIQLSRETSFVQVPESGGAYRLPGGSPLYDRTCDAATRAVELIFSKWSARWTQRELARLWNAAKVELTPALRKQREAELARLRAEADEAGRTLAAVESRQVAAERRAAEAEAALEDMAASSAVRAARFVRSLNPGLHRAVGRLGRRVLGIVDRRPAAKAATAETPLRSSVPPSNGILEACPEFCGRNDQPGLAIDRPDLVDYSQSETTPDQAEIEAVLEQMGIEGKRILHVGIGNSSLARKFAHRTLAIEGLTVSRAEHAVSCELGLSNYRVHLLSKHDPRLCGAVAGPFDVIVDNNLASFACCRHHFRVMFEAYAALLPPGGELFTHKLGMEWTASGNAGSLTDPHLDLLAATFGFGKVRSVGGVRRLRRQ
jgi:LmbE family N-acetylglucosaminyl deacetylase